jgi:hypothetical protein
MDAFLKDIATPNWWLGVVAVGILINLVSPFIGTMLGRSSSKLLSYWRSRSEKQKASDQRLIERLRSSEYERMMAATDEVGQLLRSTLFFVSAFSLIVIGLVSRGQAQPNEADVNLMTRVVLYVLGTINFMIAVRFLLRAMALEQVRRRAMDPADVAQGTESGPNQLPSSGP